MTVPRALEARELGVRFGARTVLENFSFSMKPGGKVVLTGRSGSGKSTVLRCFLGFIVPHAGSVYIEGTPLTPETVWTLRQRLAYVAQEPDLGAATAIDAIERPFHYRANLARRRNLDRLPELLERFHISRDLLRKDAGSLSGGEKQRIALISAILLDRCIFLLDEITSALDKVSKQTIADYFQSREDATVLIVAHEPEVFAFVDRIVELGGGQQERVTT